MQFAYGAEELPNQWRVYTTTESWYPLREIWLQGSKKVMSNRPGQVNFLAAQVTLHSHLHIGQGLQYVIGELNQ